MVADSLLLPCTVKRQVNQRCQHPSMFLLHTKRAEHLQQEGPNNCGMTCEMTFSWWANSELPFSVFTSCHSTSRAEAESPIPPQKRGGDENLPHDSLPGKRQKQERDGLGASPYRTSIPPVLGELQGTLPSSRRP